MKGKIFLAAMVVLLGVLACTKDQTPPAECVDAVSFAADVAPLIAVNCSTSGCHDASAAGGYDLSSYVGIEANASRILNVINHDSGFVPMPGW
ncbi:MAG: hypothetical protein A3D92_21465 [Bacteroidetes bacterium RIFCSPHIGHO2_02_FULL_44_7]|nr:MAG: hypothetical protein A3D92_21465 [Bacteroidetes bacterium RIFCSPHIGHO2_02_FULL_44_7]